MKKITAQDKKALQAYLARLKQIQEHNLVNANESKEDKSERIKKAKKDYNFFVRHYFPHYAEFECASFHIEAAKEVLKYKDYNGIQEWARGLAKSVHFDICIPIWLHLFHNELKCMLLVSANFNAAKVLLSDIQAEFEVNPQLEHDFGKLVQMGSWETGNFRTQTGGAFYALGKGQSPRGKRNGPHRPDYIVLDDADEDEECRNPQRIDESVKWVLKALIPAMGSDITRFVMVNNRIAKISILAKLAENKTFRHRKINALLPNGEPAWSAKYSKAFYQSRIDLIGWPAFQGEYQNEPQSEGKIFTDKMIQFAPALRLNQYERIVAYWDIAYSEAKTADCNAVIIMGSVKGNTGVKHVLKAFCRQAKMEVPIRWMTYIYRHLPKTINIEWYGEGQFWNDAIDIALQTVAKETGVRLPIMFLDKAGRGQNKYSRIIQIVPNFQRNEIYFNEAEKHNADMQCGIEQLKGIEPGYKTKDDFPDVLENAIHKLEQDRVMDDYEPILGKPNEKRSY